MRKFAASSKVMKNASRKTSPSVNGKPYHPHCILKQATKEHVTVRKGVISYTYEKLEDKLL
jgi:hypothetical protein